jgi:hypothetical protein
MLTLNLLSTNQKHLVKQELIHQTVLHVMFTVFVCVVCASISLVAVQLTLQNSVQKVEQAEFAPNQGLEQKMRDTNELVYFLREVQKDWRRWSDIVADSARRAPSGIRLGSWQIDKTSRVAIYNGFAATREALLTFKEALAASPYLTNIKLPVQNIAQKEAITFTITAELRKDQ